MSKESSAAGGVGLCGAVFLIFLVLKLAEIGQVANWSWWWVTAPLWIPFGLVVGILLVVGVIALACYAIVKVIELFKKGN